MKLFDKHFFNRSEEERIVATIREAERKTSGEIRVHIHSSRLRKDVIEEATMVFGQLGMDQTALRNGVLFFLATGNKQFAIIGDEGIHEKVGVDFWDELKNKIELKFKQQDFVGGLVYGIETAGIQLHEFFPFESDDANELPDEISYD